MISMISVNMHEAKTQFSKLVAKALKGETVIVCKHNAPLIELKPIKKKNKFFIGGSKYTFDIPDDAFAPLTEEELKDWHGE